MEKSANCMTFVGERLGNRNVYFVYYLFLRAFVYIYIFMSDLSYSISCWGGIPKHVFEIPKRCIILLFRNIPNFDQILIYYIIYICILMSDVVVG